MMPLVPSSVELESINHNNIEKDIKEINEKCSSNENESNQTRVQRRILIVISRLPTREGRSYSSFQNGCIIASAKDLIDKGRTICFIGYRGNSTMNSSSPSSSPLLDSSTPSLSSASSFLTCSMNVDSSEIFSESQMISVPMDPQISRLYFNEFCKGVIWPIFHYYGKGQGQFTIENWNAYKEANRCFSNAIAESHQSDDLILIQGYQLMMVPALLRERLPKARICLFLHIPWPSSELYRTLPVRNEILQGLLGADILGFQTFSYARHFLSACIRILGLTVGDKGIHYNNRWIQVEIFPVGIDISRTLETLNSTSVQEKAIELKKKFEGMKIIVSRDRLEYIKGIPHKLRAFSTFLRMFPEWREKVVLIQECFADREILQERSYSLLAEEIEQLVGSINGQYGTIQYTPIHYLRRNVDWEDICALFSIADATLITSLREGMNLTSHEFIACQQKKMSPLILSEFTGSSQCLSGSILINPWDEKKVAKIINRTLMMSEEQLRVRFKHNYDYVVGHDAVHWIGCIVKQLESLDLLRNGEGGISTRKADSQQILSAYQASSKRLFLFDYDGTLSPITRLPSQALPDLEIVNLLKSLCSDQRNIVYLISGRDKRFLEKHLGDLPIGISCEHGAFFRSYNHQKNQMEPWQNYTSSLDLSWKDSVRAIFDDLAERTPGSFVERKEINLTWHYRNADPEFGEYQKKELILHLQNLPKLPIDILVAKKAVEVRPQGITKGYAIKRILAKETDIDFVLCIGDDQTDEDMFEELKKHEIPMCFTITVEKKEFSQATYYLDNQAEVISFLKNFNKLNLQQ